MNDTAIRFFGRTISSNAFDMKLDRHAVVGHHFLAKALALRDRSQPRMDFEQLFDSIVIGMEGDGQGR